MTSELHGGDNQCSILAAEFIRVTPVQGFAVRQIRDRMGHFYASLEHGHSAASVALRRLAGYSSTNKFYRANRDLGRIFKTEFILQYLSQPMLRRRFRRGTLKVEELHAMARDVFYAKRGRISAREIHEQMNSCSCLTLILASIIYWQAKEISRLMTYGQPEPAKKAGRQWRFLRSALRNRLVSSDDALERALDKKGD